jgi:hypothetical protein
MSVVTTSNSSVGAPSANGAISVKNSSLPPLPPEVVLGSRFRETRRNLQIWQTERTRKKWERELFALLDQYEREHRTGALALPDKLLAFAYLKAATVLIERGRITPETRDLVAVGLAHVKTARRASPCKLWGFLLFAHYHLALGQIREALQAAKIAEKYSRTFAERKRFVLIGETYGIVGQTLLKGGNPELGRRYLEHEVRFFDNYRKLRPCSHATVRYLQALQRFAPELLQIKSKDRLDYLYAVRDAYELTANLYGPDAVATFQARLVYHRGLLLMGNCESVFYDANTARRSIAERVCTLTEGSALPLEDLGISRQARQTIKQLLILDASFLTSYAIAETIRGNSMTGRELLHEALVMGDRAGDPYRCALRPVHDCLHVLQKKGMTHQAEAVGFLLGTISFGC